MKTRATFQLEIRSTDGESIPEIIRLRHVLKSMLRAFGFRVTKLTQVVDETGEETEGTTP